jgi:hypothetical protein
MANQDFPVINGIVPSWADINVKASPAGAPLITMDQIASVKRGRTVDIGEQEGASGGRVMQRTSGKQKDTFSWTLYRSGHSALLESLMSSPQAQTRGNQVAIGCVHFGVQVQHTPPGSVKVFEWRAKGVRLAGDDMESAEGVDPDKVDVPCSVSQVVDIINGKEVTYR